MNANKRALLITGIVVGLMIPAAAMASHRFNDVPDSNVFHDDISWLADAAVTLGCNPPTNDEFCPGDNVSRQQMAAFLRRFAAYLGAEDGTVTAADQATNADQLDGIDSTGFVQQAELQELEGNTISHGDIVMTHGAGAYGNPSTAFQVFGDGVAGTAGSGWANMPLTGPAVLGGVDYGLKSVSYCITNLTAPAFITDVTIGGIRFEGGGRVFEGASDSTDRTAVGCHTVTVNDAVSTSFIAAFQVSGGGGIITIGTVTSTWSPKSAIPLTSGTDVLPGGANSSGG